MKQLDSRLSCAPQLSHLLRVFPSVAWWIAISKVLYKSPMIEGSENTPGLGMADGHPPCVAGNDNFQRF